MSSARRAPLVLDPKLLPRVTAYLQAGDSSKRVQVEDIVEHLRSKHPEYSRKPYNIFLKQVSKVCEQQRERAQQELAGAVAVGGGATGIGMAAADDEEKAMDVGDEDDEVEVIEPADRNLVNSSMRALYASPTKPALPPGAPTAVAPTILAPTTTHPASATLPIASLSVSAPSSATASVNPKKRKKSLLHSSHASLRHESSSQSSPSDSWQPSFISPNLSYSDLGGLSSTLQDLRELIHYPLLHPELYSHLGLSPPSGVLLHGPAGCGQSGHTRCALVVVNCDVLSGADFVADARSV